MKDATLSRIFAFFLAIFGVVVVVAVAAVVNINRAGASRDWVNHTYATISALENTLAAVRAGDADMRTFALSGDPRDLAASRESFGAMDEQLQIADALARDTPAVQAALREIGELADRRSELAASVWQARRENQAERLRQLLAADAGSDAIGVIKRRLEKLRDDQFSLLREREQVAYRQAQTTRWIVGTGVACNLVLFCAVGWLIRDDLRARRRLTETLQAANETLEARVQERTRELAASNEKLSAENLERQWAAQSLEHQLRYNQIIVSATSDLVFVVTKALAVTRINPAVVERTGRPEEELLGRPLLELVQAAHAATFTQALRSGRELHDLPASITDRQGLVMPVHLTLLPLRDNDKVVGGVVLLQPTRPLASP